jgi:LuxR family transcriptional regulator, maltose regulon positive regulatory protein
MHVQATDPAPARHSPSGGVVVATKLHVPPARPGLVERARLHAILVGGGPRKLTVVEAPAGSGKTTLLAHWLCSELESRPCAWLSLDEADNDPAQFWTYAVEALRTVEPDLGNELLVLLRGREDTVLEFVLPALVNELAELDRQIVLVLDDYHAISAPDIHEQLTWLLDHLPRMLEIVLATRVDPPLHLARLRARGELVHIRAGELRFSVSETGAMLSGLGLELDEPDLEQLQERTEGWAAGLYLAALSLRGRADAREFIGSFTGDDRHLADYLLSEVLEEQPAEIRRFLVRTSILRRLCGPLCDALTEDGRSNELLAEIERSNLFVIPLDTRREWYRYHQLFGRLLQLELERSEPELVPELHRRAANWCRAMGSVADAIHHAAAAGDVDAAANLIADNWMSFFNHGRLATVSAWLDSLPVDAVEADRRLAVARAWVALDRGRLDEAGRWIATAESVQSGELESEVAVLGAVHRFKIGDISAARAAAERAIALESFSATAASCILGITLHLSDSDGQAESPLSRAVGLAREDGNQLGAAYALGYLALIDAQAGRLDDADERAQAALSEGSEPGFSQHFVLSIAHLARAEVERARGHAGAEEESAARAVELARRGAGRLELAASLMALAAARQASGDVEAAGELLEQASALIERCADPGNLGRKLDDAARRFRRPRGKREVTLRDELSDRELAVLRLLPSGLSAREIGDELFVSINTVKSHIKAIYRKLGATSREDAVQRGRELRLI